MKYSILFLFIFLTSFTQPTTTSATLISSCSTCQIGSDIVFTGSGYPANQTIAVTVQNSSGFAYSFNGGESSPDGTISFSVNLAAGNYVVSTFTTKGHKSTFKASCNISIQ